jgi:hypothetical protein
MALEDLKAAASKTENALRHAAGWLAEPANQERVGSVRKSLERNIRSLAVDAEKLVSAADRSMCVAVFGPSQVGKSHLVGVLAAPQGEELMAVFDGHEDTSYMLKINPDKNQEATGLVTRFTTQKITTPGGYPVCLRLLSHADILKIICNAYYFDCNPNKYEGSELSGVDLQAHLAKFESMATGKHENGLRTEDLWDLQEYFKSTIGEFVFYQTLDTAFWNAAAHIVPKLDAKALAGFFEILWNKHEVITKLYLKLFEALQSLKFSQEAFCPLTAITEEIRIIDVDALIALASDDGKRVRVSTGTGSTVEMTQAVLAALTAELRIVISKRAWDFQAHTDILDFPGYRTRGLPGLELEHAGRIGIAALLIKNPAESLSRLFIRGKVDYLFRRYVAEQEITAMMLCIKEGNMDIVTLPEVINNWIEKTHGGKEASDRLGKDTLLFFVLTRFDIMLSPKANEGEANPIDNYQGRMNASLVDKFSNGYSWPNEWTPGKSFQNTFLMRSPTAKSTLFKYDQGVEISILETEQPRIEKQREAFSSAPLVKKHFANPSRAFDEMLKIGDGGTSYIVENLSKVCLADTKPKQVRARLQSIALKAHEALHRYYISTNIDERLKESESAAQSAIDAIEGLLQAGRFGSFLQALFVNGGLLSAHLQRVIVSGTSRQIDDTTKQEPLLPRPGALSRPGALPRPGTPAPETAQPIATTQMKVESRDLDLAQSAVEFWISSMQASIRSEALQSYLGMKEEIMQRIVTEIAAAASRVGLPLLIAQELSKLSNIEVFDQHVAKACVVAEHRINRFVSLAGFNYTPENERPFTADGTSKVFASQPIRFSAQALPEQANNPATLFTIDWIYAFFEMVRANAMSERGQTFDIEQNRRLGGILETLEQVKS